MFPVRPFVYPNQKSPLACGEVSLDAFARKYGTPLYVYSADAIRYRLGLFTEAFAGLDHVVCYAVKANSALAILKLLDRAGAGFDIVSGGELERVLAVNKAATARVVFSGVGKTAPEIDLALRSGILLFNVESEGELDLLVERASRL
ncbi:MAG: diaminopimelate decarboxylase family protein, partial [Acidobacteriaceae bacterium]